MSVLLWFLLFFIKYFCLFSLNSLILGVSLLIGSLSISLLIRRHMMSWYSLIFFLVYVGGLLVLFIYVSSLNFNPVFYLPEKKSLSGWFSKLKIGFILFLTLTQITWNFKGYFWNPSLDTKNFSLNLFKEFEILFLIKVGLLLLLVLWVITKLSFEKKGALRPFFG